MKQSERETLNKICNLYSKEQLKTILEEYQNFSIENQKVIEKSAICSYFLLLKEQKNLHPYLVLKPFILKSLNQLDLSIQELLPFLDWYIALFSTFYSDKKNFELYINEKRNLNTQIIHFLDSYFEENNVLELKDNLQSYTMKLIEEEKKERTVFAGYYLIANKMRYEEKKGIPYREQYDFLNHFINETILVKICFGNRLLRKQEEKVDKEVQLKENVLPNTHKDLKQVLISQEDISYIEYLKIKLNSEDSLDSKILIKNTLLAIEDVVEEYNFLKRSEQVFLKSECQNQIELLLKNLKQSFNESMKLERIPK